MEKEEVLKKFKKDILKEDCLIRAYVSDYAIRTLIKGEVKRRTYRFEIEVV